MQAQPVSSMPQKRLQTLTSWYINIEKTIIIEAEIIQSVFCGFCVCAPEKTLMISISSSVDGLLMMSVGICWVSKVSQGCHRTKVSVQSWKVLRFVLNCATLTLFIKRLELLFQSIAKYAIAQSSSYSVIRLMRFVQFSNVQSHQNSNETVFPRNDINVMYEAQF